MMDPDNYENEDYMSPFGAMNPTGMVNPYYVDLQASYMPAQGMVPMNQNAYNSHYMPWNYDYVQNSFYDGLINVNANYVYNPMGSCSYTNDNGLQSLPVQAQPKSENVNLSDSNGLNGSNATSQLNIQTSVHDGSDAAQPPTSGRNAKENGDDEFAKENQPLYLESISATFIQEENDAAVASPPLLSTLLEQQETATTTSDIESPAADASTTYPTQKHMSPTHPNSSRMNMYTYPRSHSANYGQSGLTGNNMDNNTTSAPCYMGTVNNPENYTHAMQETARTCATSRDDWNQTYAEASFNGTLPPSRSLGHTWGGNVYYNDYAGMNMVNDNVGLGKMVYRHPKMYPYGDGYAAYSQEPYSGNSLSADAHKYKLNMTVPYGDTLQMHHLSHAPTENPSVHNMATFDCRGYPPSAAYSCHDQHLDYNNDSPLNYQTNGNVVGLSGHTMIPNLSNPALMYPKHMLKEAQMDDCNLGNINLNEIDFINMSDKTWLTLRGAGMFKLGNKGRAILKSKISKQLKTNSQMRMRASLISGVRRATTRQLFQLAQICGIKSHLK